MLYHPYFRGKQYELITVREMAPLMKTAGFCPIIEPVRETLSGLEKALRTLADVEGHGVLVVNPHHGDLSGAGEPLTKLLKDKFLGLRGISAGILLKQETSLDEALDCYRAHAAHAPALIHAGFTDAKGLAEKLGQASKDHRHIFLDRFCGKLYQRHFKGARRILLKDG